MSTQKLLDEIDARVKEFERQRSQYNFNGPLADQAIGAANALNDLKKFIKENCNGVCDLEAQR